MLHSIATAGRLVELGERKRREQLVAARALLLRDGDGGPVGVLGRRGIGGVALEQDFAADAMQFCFECARKTANSRPLANTPASWIVATIAEAVTGRCAASGADRRDLTRLLAKPA